MNLIGKNRILQQFFVLLGECGNLFVAANVQHNMIRDLKARIFSHGLHFRNQLAHKALFDECLIEFNVEHHGDAVVLRRDIALRLCALD